uniref:Mab-21 domain-containing protein n=1 Tax=Macrostomum lignano TaxID=282301 RepID=A0A1I8HYI3_9PLAT
DSETHSVDDKLSKQLHKRLSQAGFVDSRASLQSALGDVLQQILQKRIGNLNIVFVVGSYSEGWGNNLVTLNGRTDIESDIDVMQLILGRLYHLRDWCQCREVKISDAVEYRNGHIFVQGFASNPAQTSHGTALRPSVDHVPACRLCCYPSIAPLLPDRASKSHIRSQVLDALRKELETSPCHAVHAASPTKRGEELRLSTTFLERRLLRSLTTLQGQLFVTLKYLVKKVICPRVNGMKAYHAKTVTFRMLEETAQSEWKPENFVKLLRRALKMLLNSVMKSSIQDKRETNKDGEVMEHFFLCDAAIYLKGANSRDAQEIANVLKDVLENLHQHLNDLMNYVQPTDASGRFAFHPFLILPILDHKPVSGKGSIEYHQIYDVVREGICQLCFSDCGAESQEALMKLIGRLPVCARSAREALRALAFLKFEQSDSALKVLTNCEWFRVSRGIDWPERSRVTDATPEFVWKHLKSCDSAWKFCFEFKEIPTLKFLPKPLSSCCIINLEHVAYDCYYVNFEAVLQTLRLELSSNRVMADKWVEDVLNREDADGQEMLLCALSCTSSEQLSKVSGKLKSAAYLNAHADRLLLEKEVKLSRQETIRFVGKI